MRVLCSVVPTGVGVTCCSRSCLVLRRDPWPDQGSSECWLPGQEGVPRPHHEEVVFSARGGDVQIVAAFGFPVEPVQFGDDRHLRLKTFGRAHCDDANRLLVPRAEV